MTAFDNAIGDLGDANNEYESKHQEIESLNQQLETTKLKISELEGKGTLSITEQGDLERLKLQNAELERTLKLKEKEEKNASDKATKKAEKALDIDRVSDLSTSKKTTNIDKNGFSHEIVTVDKTDILTAGQNELKELEKIKSKRDKLLSKSNTEGLSKAEEKELKTLDKSYEKYNNALSDKMENLQSIREGLIDKRTGKAKKGYGSIVDDIDAILNGVANIDLSPAEHKLANLDTYFSSTSGSAMKSYLEGIVKDGGTAQDALDKFRESGMRLKDIGVDKNTFKQYFDDIKKSAEEAENGIKNYHASVSNVKKAGESENAICRAGVLFHSRILSTYSISDTPLKIYK